jgi:hypothetical protein
MLYKYKLYSRLYYALPTIRYLNIKACFIYKMLLISFIEDKPNLRFSYLLTPDLQQDHL